MTLTQVNSAGIEDDSIVNADIKSDAAIAGSKLADNAVGLAQMASGTDGQIITYDASGDPIAVGPGTDGQVLTSTGAGSPPAFEDIPAAGAALTGSTDNTICTVTGANAIQGEANLTFDGTDLKVTKDLIPTVHAQNTNAASYSRIILNQSSGSGGYAALNKLGTSSTATGGANATQLWCTGDAPLVFGVNNAERWRIRSNGHLESNDTNLALLRSGTTGDSDILFGDSADDDIGRIRYDHDDDSLQFLVNAAERLRIDSSGRVGIGTTAPADYDAEAANLVIASSDHTGVTIASTGTDKRTNLYFADGTSGNAQYRGAFTYEHSDDSLRVRTAGAERIRVHAGGETNFTAGIVLGNGSTYAAANTLDEYEEGTFTPAFANESGTSKSPANSTGKYTRIGRVVHLSVFANCGGSASIGNQNIGKITGLPFNGNSEPNSSGLFLAYGGGNNAQINSYTACYVAQGGTEIKFKQSQSCGVGNITLFLTYTI